MEQEEKNEEIDLLDITGKNLFKNKTMKKNRKS
jgi:hypothetical protein